MYQQILNRLSEEVVSQPEAVKAFARAAVRAMDGALGSANRPAAALLLGGPTGSGKAHLTSVFARLLLGNEQHLVRVAPSFSTSVAACAAYLATACGPPGMPGVLRVVCIEGVEKAHPSVLDLLSHIFSTGELPLAPGVAIDFRHTVFALLTGVAEREVDDLATRSVGFSGGDRDVDDRIRGHVEAKIYASFSPRFLSFIDEIVVLRRMDEDDLPFILEKILDRLEERLLARGVHLHVDSAVRDFVLAEGRRGMRFGAKGLRRAADRYIETPLADLLATRPLPPGATLFMRRTLEGIALYVPA